MCVSVSEWGWGDQNGGCRIGFPSMPPERCFLFPTNLIGQYSSFCVPFRILAVFLFFFIFCGRPSHSHQQVASLFFLALTTHLIHHVLHDARHCVVEPGRTPGRPRNDAKFCFAPQQTNVANKPWDGPGKNKMITQQPVLVSALRPWQTPQSVLGPTLG